MAWKANLFFFLIATGINNKHYNYTVVTIALLIFRYGELQAQNVTEESYSIFSMLVGTVVYFGMLLGGLTSILTTWDQPRGYFYHKYGVIKNHLVSLSDITSEIIDHHARPCALYYE